MKKILISVLFLLGTISMVSAEIGLKIGVSGSLGLYEATGTEKDTDSNTGMASAVETNGNLAADDNLEAIGAMGSYFIEKTLQFLPGPLGRLSIGYDYVPHEIKTGTTSRSDKGLNGDLGAKSNQVGSLAADRRDIINKASATIDNINTVYATITITDWLYLKAGHMEADVTTTESLETGSTYGNLGIDGVMYGIGIQQQMDNGIFFRFEANHTDLDGGKLTSQTNSDNVIELNDITGDSAKFSIGKSF